VPRVRNGFVISLDNAFTVRRLPAMAAIVVAVAIAACGGDDDAATTEGAAPTTSAAEEASAPAEAGKESPKGGRGAPARGTELVAADSQYGEILFDSEQRAIYLFDKETSESSQCYGACAEAWPPVLTEGRPRAGAGLDPKLLGTTERDDGSTQVTYNGHPLYYYVDDPRGEVLCHNVEEFGGLWLVVEPSGQPVQ
jgi:predicted lipoprotein with Yx(FWY)xxD motif